MHAPRALTAAVAVAVLLLLALAVQGGTAQYDKDFGACSESDPSQAVEGEHEVVSELRTRFPIVYDLGTYAMGMGAVTLSTAAFTLTYEHTNLKSRLLFRKFKYAYAVEPAPVTLQVNRIVLEKKEGRNSWSYKPTTIEFDGAVVTLGVYAEAVGTYNDKNTRSKGNLEFDVRDTGFGEENNDIDITISNMEWELEGGSALIRKAIKSYSEYWEELGSIVQRQVGRGLKCLMRSAQPNILHAVHAATMEATADLAALRRCGADDGALRACQTVIKSRTGSAVDVASAATPSGAAAAVQAAAADLVNEIEATMPLFRVDLSADGSIGSSRSLALEYHAGVVVDLPTKHVVQAILGDSAGIILEQSSSRQLIPALSPSDRAEEPAPARARKPAPMLAREGSRPAPELGREGSDGSLEESYLRDMMKEFLKANVKEANLVAAVVEYIKNASIQRKTELSLRAHEVNWNIHSSGDVLDPPVSETAFGSLRLILDNQETKEAAYFPLDLVMESFTARRNREYVESLCQREFPADKEEWPLCIEDGLKMNKDRTEMDRDRVSSLLSSDRYKVRGEFDSGGDSLVLNTILDGPYWARVAQSACPVDMLMCQDLIGLFGNFLVHTPTSFDIRTPDMVPKAAGAWEGDRRRGVDISKRAALINLDTKYVGEINVGVLLAITSNAREYLKQQALKRTPLDDLAADAAMGAAVVGIMDTTTPGTPWRREYDLGRFIDDL